MFFQDTLLDPFFFIFFGAVSKTVILGPPSKSSGRQLATKIAQFAPKCCKNLMSPCSGVRPWNRLVLQRLPDTPNLGTLQASFFKDLGEIRHFFHLARQYGIKLNPILPAENWQTKTAGNNNTKGLVYKRRSNTNTIDQTSDGGCN
jgi:hypothetical protein